MMPSLAVGLELILSQPDEDQAQWLASVDEMVEDWNGLVEMDLLGQDLVESVAEIVAWNEELARMVRAEELKQGELE